MGKAKAITATARKFVILSYNMLRHGMSYVDPGATYYKDRYKQRVLDNLQRRAKSLGFVLHQIGPDTAKADVFLGILLPSQTAIPSACARRLVAIWYELPPAWPTRRE